MCILFVHPNYHSGGAEIAGNWPPAWVTYLAGSLKAKNFHDILFIDAMTLHVGPEDLRARPVAFEPDIIGVTAITPSVYAAEDVLQLAAACVPNALRVLGGVEAPFMFRQVLSEARGSLPTPPSPSGLPITRSPVPAGLASGMPPSLPGCSRPSSGAQSGSNQPTRRRSAASRSTRTDRPRAKGNSVRCQAPPLPLGGEGRRLSPEVPIGIDRDKSVLARLPTVMFT